MASPLAKGGGGSRAGDSPLPPTPSASSSPSFAEKTELGPMKGSDPSALASLATPALHEAGRVILILVAIAWILSLTASCSTLLNIPLAFLIILGGNILHRRATERLETEAEGRVRSMLADLLPSPSVPPTKCKAADQWRSVVGDAVLCDAWELFVKSVVKEFIADLFWTYITPDDELPETVTKTLHGILAELCIRTRHVNVGSLLLCDIVSLVQNHIDSYRDVAEMGDATEWGMSDEAQEHAFQRCLAEKGDLHPALASEEAELANMQMIAQGIMLKLMPADEMQSAAVRALVREVLAICVLKPVTDIFTPEYANMFLLMLMDYECHTKIMKRVMEANDGDGKSSVSDVENLVSPLVRESARDDKTEMHGEGSKSSMSEMKCDVLQMIELDDDIAAGDEEEEYDSDDSDNDLIARPIDDSEIVPNAVMSRERKSEWSPSEAEALRRELDQVEGDHIPVGCAPLLPKGRCTVNIIGAGLMVRDEKEFVAYRIRVSDGHLTWHVLRRYKNFEVLHKNLKNVRGFAHKLPPKRTFNHQMTKKFVNMRKNLLDRYLTMMLSDDVLAENHELWRFLSENEYGEDVGGMFSSMSRRIKQTTTISRRASQRSLKGIQSVGRTLTLKSGNLSRRLTGAVDGKSGALGALEGSTSHRRNMSADTVVLGLESIDDIQEMTLEDVLSESSSESRQNMSAGDDSEDSSEGVGTVSNNSFEAKLSNDLRGLGLNLVGLVDTIFRLKSRGWFKRQVLGVARQMLHTMLGGTIDSFIASQLTELCKGPTIAKYIDMLHKMLWIDGIWFESHPDKMTDEQWIEYSRFSAACTRLLLVDCAPATLVRLIGKSEFRKDMNDVYAVLQSKIFMKRFGLVVLDLLVKTWFPELEPIVDRTEARAAHEEKTSSVS